MNLARPFLHGNIKLKHSLAHIYSNKKESKMKRKPSQKYIG